MIYVFYTDLNITDNYIFKETKEELDKHGVFKDINLVKGEEFTFNDVSYRIVDIFDYKKHESEPIEGRNVLCEIIK